MNTRSRENRRFSFGNVLSVSWYVVIIVLAFVSIATRNDRARHKPRVPTPTPKPFGRTLPGSAAPAQPQPQVPPKVTTGKKTGYPFLDRLFDFRVPPPKQTAADPPQPAKANPPEAAPTTVDATPKYSAEFEKVWGTTGNAEFLEGYEATCKDESGVGFNDQQKKYVHDVVAEDMKARAFEIYNTCPQPISEDKLNEVFTAAGEQMAQESGPVHQFQLLLLMDGEQVAKLNSFFAGLNAGTPAATVGAYTPAIEYLVYGGEGDKATVEDWKATLESSWGIKLNTAQEAYIRNTWVPSWKAQAAAAVGKLDLGSGKVSGQELGAALEAGFSSIEEHMEKLHSLMDENQRRLIELHSKASKQSQ